MTSIDLGALGRRSAPGLRRRCRATAAGSRGGLAARGRRRRTDRSPGTDARGDQRRVDAVLEHRAVLDQVQPEARLLALGAHAGSGSQIAGTRSRCESTASTWASIRSVLQASGASPLTFWASATAPPSPAPRACRARTAPRSSTRSRRAPAPMRPNARQAAQPSASGGAANPATTSPAHDQADIQPPATQIQSSVQHEHGPPRARSSMTAERATGEALLHRIPKHERQAMSPASTKQAAAPDHGVRRIFSSPSPCLGQARQRACRGSGSPA